MFEAELEQTESKEQINSNPFAPNNNNVSTGTGNIDRGNGNNFVGDSEGETGSNSQANGNGNWYFGNDNQTSGNGNWYISQESDLPDNFLEGEGNSNSFIANLFGNNGNSSNSIGGNNPAFAGGGVPSFSFDSIDFSQITDANGNQTEGNGNWYFGEGNSTNGNGNWEFGENNQTEGNANWNFGDGNSITGNGNQPGGNGNSITGNGNQPSGDDNQINGNRVSPEESNQNIVGNGDRYLLMDSQGNVFVVNDESANDTQYQFDFEYLTNTNGNESETASLDQPFVENLFSQFASGNTTSNTRESENQISFSGGNPLASNSETNNSSNNNSDNQNSDLDEQLSQSPFGRLLDLPGVDGAEDIFGNLGAPSGESSEGGGIGEGNPFAFWDPVTEGNPFTPDDDTPENANLGGGNSFTGGGSSGGSENPFAGGGSSGGSGNPFAGGENTSGGGSMQSPWDALLQFEEFDSVEDILGIPTGNNPGGGENSNSNNVAERSSTEQTKQTEESRNAEIFSNFSTEETFSFENADFENTNFESAMGEEFTETPIADLLDFPGVDSAEDIFSTFGVGDDANGENLLEDWNPFTDGNPFVVNDEDETEPIYNADGDTLLVENQFGYIIQNSEDKLFLSLDDTINENDVEISQGGFPDDLFDSNQNNEEFPDDTDVGNFLEGQEIAIEIENGYLLNNETGNWFISSDDALGEEDISLGDVDLLSENNPFAEDIESFFS
jgi:hypothetical protein